jgi:hypothetical protein
MKWTETGIARALARQTFNRQHLVVVPNCNWTGRECDLLVVTGSLRIIKADAKKDKWWQHVSYSEALATGKVSAGERWDPYAHRVPREWPIKVWKHYYCMPREIWDDTLFSCLGSPASGVLLLTEQKERGSRGAEVAVHCERRATPCKTAEVISPAAAVDIARLASLRMWDSYQKLEEIERKAVPA